jgi:ParB/RepB/Spo0J family partition protein
MLTRGRARSPSSIAHAGARSRDAALVALDRPPRGAGGRIRVAHATPASHPAAGSQTRLSCPSQPSITASTTPASSWCTFQRLSPHASTDKRADIEALAASIAAHGLLQNLSVVAVEDETYAVVAGARRLAALKLLAKSGKIAKDASIPCTLVAPAMSAEASLAENVQRVAMHPMDEMEAFAALVDGGLSTGAVAERFGCSVRHVEQRLALARLSPKLRAAYRKGEITLEVARAFCLSDDHGVQERLFKQLGNPITHAYAARAAKTSSAP